MVKLFFCRTCGKHFVLLSSCHFLRPRDGTMWEAYQFMKKTCHSTKLCQDSTRLGWEHWHQLPGSHPDRCRYEGVATHHEVLGSCDLDDLGDPESECCKEHFGKKHGRFATFSSSASLEHIWTESRFSSLPSCNATRWSSRWAVRHWMNKLVAASKQPWHSSFKDAMANPCNAQELKTTVAMCQNVQSFHKLWLVKAQSFFIDLWWRDFRVVLLCLERSWRAGAAKASWLKTLQHNVCESKKIMQTMDQQCENAQQLSFTNRR